MKPDQPAPVLHQSDPTAAPAEPGAESATVASTEGRTGQDSAPGTPPNETTTLPVNPSPSTVSPGFSAVPAAEISGKSGAKGLANLRRGGIQQHRQEKAAREEERKGRAATRAGVLEILQEITADPNESGAYRTAAARLLLTPDPQEARPPEYVSKSVEAWIEASYWRERGIDLEAYAVEGRCTDCERLFAETAPPRVCAAKHNGSSNGK